MRSLAPRILALQVAICVFAHSTQVCTSGVERTFNCRALRADAGFMLPVGCMGSGVPVGVYVTCLVHPGLQPGLLRPFTASLNSRAS
jgi:hypothetical protein